MDERAPEHQTLVVALAIGVCLIVGIWPTLTPPSAQGDTGAISIDRAVVDVEFMAQEPHVMGTPQIDRVREYLIASLSEAGLEPETLTIETPDYFGAPGGTVDVIDVLARIAGTGDRKAILLMAHYDTVPTTSGANDNSAAVAALLEVARILVAGPPPPNDVIFLFTDGEEPTPRYGAWGFAEFHPWFDDVGLAVNLEGIGVSGPAVLVEVSGPKGELVSRLADAVPSPIVYSFMTQTAELIGGAATDFDVFRDRGIPGYNFTYMRGTSIYHTERDSIANLNVAGIAHQGSLALGIARSFGSADVPLDGTDAVFFTVPFRVVVHYSTFGSIASLLAALLLVGGTIWNRVNRRGSSLRGVRRGLRLVLVTALASLTVSTLVWIGLVKLRPEMGLVEGYVYLAVLVGLTSGGWYVARRLSVGSGGDVVSGLFVMWGALALVVGTLLPGFGYLFVWPAIAAGLAEVLVSRNSRVGVRLGAVVGVALTTFVVLVPAVDLFFHFASPRPGNPGSEMPAVIVIPVLLTFLAVGLIDTSVSESADPVSA